MIASSLLHNRCVLFCDIDSALKLFARNVFITAVCLIPTVAVAAIENAAVFVLTLNHGANAAAPTDNFNLLTFWIRAYPLHAIVHHHR